MSDPFDWRGPSISGLVPKISTDKATILRRASRQRERDRASATRVNPESYIAYTRRNAADKTLSIRNSTP